MAARSLSLFTWWFGSGSSKDDAPPRRSSQSAAELSIELFADPLVARLRADDPRVLAELHVALAADLWRYADHLLQDRDAAEDVVQETFVVLWERRAILAPQIVLRPYLFTAVRHRALKRLRHDDVVQRTALIGEPLEPTSAPMPDTYAEQQTLGTLVRQALERLPERQREAIELRWRRRLNYTETAAVLGISEAAVRKLVYKALGRLSELQRILKEP